MRPKKKGREDPPEHRLFRRLRGHGLEGESNLEQILELIRAKESNLKLNEKQLRSQIQETLVHACRKRELFIGNAQSFELRELAQVEQIEANVRHWRDLGSNEKEDDLLNDCLKSILKSEGFSDQFSLLKGEILRTWLGFDLVKQVEKIAIKRSGLRFPDPLVSMAWLMRDQFSPEELLDYRLSYRRKNGENPFERQYRIDLIDHAATLPEPTLDDDREDLRHLPFVTIDPPDAKDFDDAICFQNDTLWVAIADVAHYVKPGTALDRYALSRATSVYLPHCVLPMLPPRLADDLCSLNAGVDKYAMVIEMKIEDAQVVATKAHQALIKISENLSYSDALNDERFQDLIALSKNMRNRRIGLDIAGAEIRPRIKQDTIELEVKWPNDATEMIEAFMVATNEAVGHLLGKEQASLPWRCHSPPDKPEVESLNAKLAALNVDIELPMPSHRKSGQSESSETLDLLSAWAGLSIEEEVVEGDYLSSVIDSDARGEILISLREAQYKANSLSQSHKRVVDQGLFQLMQRANYSEENFGHFGLDLDAYVHFTSPIRRYPDLIVHRQLKALLAGKDWIHTLEEVAQMAEHCSMRGTQAKRLEWELVASTCNMHLMNSTTGSSWNARVVGLRSPWIFLDLEDDGSFQGRMHLSQLGGKERLMCDEHGLKVETQNGSVVLELGQRFNCRLRGLDIWSGALDLAPI